MSAPDTNRLNIGLDQFAALAARVTDENAGTPCTEWTVGALVDHVTASTANFAAGVRGQEVDWAAAPVRSDDRAAAFRNRADELLAAWQAAGETGGGPGPDWQLAELSVHTWDLATALGVPTTGLDPQVAESGLAFMESNLTDERRGAAFGPKQQAGEGADAYTRIAAFAGRHV